MAIEFEETKRRNEYKRKLKLISNKHSKRSKTFTQ